MHPLKEVLLFLMCRRVLLVVLQVSHRHDVELFSTAGPLCPLGILMVCDWRVLRALSMSSCLPNLHAIFFCLPLFYIFLHSVVGCMGLGSSINRVFLLSPSVAFRLILNTINNNKINFTIYFNNTVIGRVLSTARIDQKIKH